jgi:multicomponent Na+:H+ antiporter subunit B
MNGDHHVILRVVAKALIPIISVFGFFVHFHGEYSPGGGFQAGVILAVAIILYSLIFGIAPCMRAITPGFARTVAAFGLFLYALFREAPGGHLGQHVGIIVIELGVLAAVAGSMVAIYYAFAGRVSEIRDEDW